MIRKLIAGSVAVCQFVFGSVGYGGGSYVTDGTNVITSTFSAGGVIHSQVIGLGKVFRISASSQPYFTDTELGPSITFSPATMGVDTVSIALDSETIANFRPTSVIFAQPLGVTGDITFDGGEATLGHDGDSLNIVANTATASDDFEVTAEFANFIVDRTQWGDATTDIHGINLTPVSKQMLTASFADDDDDSSSYFINGKLTHTGDVLSEDEESVGYFLDQDITGTINISDNGLEASAFKANQFTDMTLTEDSYDIWGFNMISSFAETSSIGASATANQHGVQIQLSGNMGTTGSTKKYGDRVAVSGTSDINYAIFAQASGATTNWAFFNQGGGMFMGGDGEESSWGTGYDATATFDGDSLNIVANAVTGSDNLEITANLVDFGASPITTTGDITIDSDSNGLILGDSQNSTIKGVAAGLNIGSTAGTINITSSVDITINPVEQDVFFQDDGTNLVRFNLNKDTDQILFGLSDEGGNQWVITEFSNAYRNHDHALQTDPTVFIHSDTSSDSDNTQWGSLSHNKTDFVFNAGTGAANFSALDIDTTGNVIIDSDSSSLQLGDAQDALLAWNETTFNKLRATVSGGVFETTTGSGGATVMATSVSGSAAGIAANRPDGVWARVHSASSAAQFLFENGGQFWITEAGAGNVPWGSSFSGNIFMRLVASGTDRIEINKQMEFDTDSLKLFFGAGNDASITFDGDSLNIVANAVTSTDIIISASTTTVKDGTGDQMDIGRGTGDTNITFIKLFNTDGEVAYIYPNADQNGIVVQATHP